MKKRAIMIIFILLLLSLTYSLASHYRNESLETDQIMVTNQSFMYFEKPPENSIIAMSNNVVHDGIISTDEYDFTEVLDPKYNLSYTVDNTAIYFALEVNALGWVAIGFDPIPGDVMNGADIIIGYWDTANTGSFIQDNIGTKAGKHAKDTTDNILSFAAGENSGWTTLEFSRLLNTGDVSQDKVITVGVSTSLIWAYHSTKDTFVDKHSGAGYATVTFQEITVPTEPQNLVAAASASQVSLTWQTPTGDGGSAISKYRVYRSLTNGGPYTNIANTTGLSYSDTTVTNGDTFYYVVTAENAKGESIYSNQEMANPIGVPTAPQNLVATSSAGQVILNWTAPLKDGGSTITGYKVKRSMVDGGSYTPLTTTSTLSHVDTLVTNGDTYYYVVSADNSVGESPISNQAIGNPGAVPSSPQSLAAISGDNNVSLSWAAPADIGGSPIFQFHVYRSINIGGPFTNIANTTELKYNDTSAQNGNTYYYGITAENAIGEGPISTIVDIIPSTFPNAPNNLNATSSDGQVILNWTIPSDDGGLAISGYKIYRSDGVSGNYNLLASSSSTSYVDIAVLNGNTYYYIVTAVNTNGESISSNEVISTPATLPSSPTNLVATSGNNNVSLTWTAPSDDGGSSITKYRVYRATSSGGQYTNIDNTTQLNYLDISAQNGNPYYYIVTAINTKGESLNSNEASATPATVPSSPTNLVATSGNNNVSLTWTASSDDGGSSITKYRVYRRTIIVGYTNIANTTSLNYLDTSTINGITYYYVVTAMNTKGNSLNSNEVGIRPEGPPSVPQNLIAIAGDNNVSLTWTAPSNDGGSSITKYRVYRSTVMGGSYTNIANTTLVKYNDTSALNGNIYYYVITAENAIGESSNSNEARATLANVPSAPLNLNALGGNNQITLTWSVPSDSGDSPITHYRVYRSLVMGGSYSNIANTTSLNYLDNYALNGIKYYYVVSAVNIDGESPNSNEASAIPATIPDAPVNLIATPGNMQISLNWIAPSDNGGSVITQYKVYRSISSGDFYSLITSLSTTSYVDNALINGNIYYYIVTAINEKGESLNSIETSAIPATTSIAPSTLIATPGDSRVILNWTNPSDDGGSPITKYHIYRSTSTGGSYGHIGNTTDLFYIDNSVINGITYFYVITAENSVGESIYSLEVNENPGITPTPPLNLIAKEENNQISLNWSSPKSDGGFPIIEYRIYRSTSSGGTYTFIGSTSNTTYVDGTVTNGNTYYYIITVVNARGESQYSNGVTATPATVPNAPQNLIYTVGNNQAILNWSAPSSNGGSIIIEYNIYRSNSSGGSFVKIATTSELGYVDSTVSNGISYYYVISAINIQGESAFSNEVVIVPATVPDPPQNLTSSSENRKISVNWDAPVSDGGSKILEYHILRSIKSSGSYVNIANTTGLSYTDNSVTNGIIYYYVVSAINKYGNSTYSNEIYDVASTFPGNPQNLTATSEDNLVELGWLAPVSDGGSKIIIYKVYRSNASGGKYNVIGNSTNLKYNDTEVINGNIYYYVVSAINIRNESGFSNEVSAKPFKKTTTTSSEISISTTSDTQTTPSLKTDGSFLPNNQTLGLIAALSVAFVAGAIIVRRRKI